jgi:hypothetical protein
MVMLDSFSTLVQHTPTGPRYDDRVRLTARQHLPWLVINFALRGSQATSGLPSDQTAELHAREMTPTVTSLQPLSDETLRLSMRRLCLAGWGAGELRLGCAPAANDSP